MTFIAFMAAIAYGVDCKRHVGEYKCTIGGDTKGKSPQPPRFIIWQLSLLRDCTR